MFESDSDTIKGIMIYIDKVELLLTLVEASQFKELWEMTISFINNGEMHKPDDKTLQIAWKIMYEMIVTSYNNIKAESVKGRWLAAKKRPEWKNKSLGEWFAWQSDFNPDWIKNHEERNKAIGIFQEKKNFERLEKENINDKQGNENKPSSTCDNVREPSSTNKYNIENINNPISINNTISNHIIKTNPIIDITEELLGKTSCEKQSDYDYSSIDPNKLPF